jgi:hypothetical protein
MNLKNALLEHLKTNVTQHDEEWIVECVDGFDWWPHRHRQSVRVISLPSDTDEELVKISISTEVAGDVAPSERLFEELDWIAKECSLSAPVYLPESSSVHLCSTVLANIGNCDATLSRIAVAQTLQHAEVALFAPRIVKTFGATESVSGHPDSGVREEPSLQTHTVEYVFGPLGLEESLKPDVYERYFVEINEFIEKSGCSLLTNFGPESLTTEFPWGLEESSLTNCLREEHTLLGPGIRITQQFPVNLESPLEYWKTAAELNREENVCRPRGQGLGAYAFRADNNTLQWSTFLPMAVIEKLLLPKTRQEVNQMTVQMLVEKAEQVSEKLTGHGWTPESFDPKRSATGRMFAMFGGDREAHIDFLVKMMSEKIENEGKDN